MSDNQEVQNDILLSVNGPSVSFFKVKSIEGLSDLESSIKELDLIIETKFNVVVRRDGTVTMGGKPMSILESRTYLIYLSKNIKETIPERNYHVVNTVQNTVTYNTLT